MGDLYLKVGGEEILRVSRKEVCGDSREDKIDKLRNREVLFGGLSLLNVGYMLAGLIGMVGGVFLKPEVGIYVTGIGTMTVLTSLTLNNVYFVKKIEEYEKKIGDLENRL